MRTNTYGAFIALALMTAATSCSEEMIKSPIPNQGDEVNFGAQLTSPNSRTYYGEPIDQNGTRVFPIYWNDLAKGYDKIFIYAPDGLSGRNQSYYSVRPTEANQTTPAAVVKTDEVGVQWAGEDKPTDFYGFYPGNAEFNISAEGTKITATMPGNQQVTYTDKFNPEDFTPNKIFEALPDMSCCMMVATTENVQPTTEAISLQFNPLSSVLDVTVNGPDEETNTKHDIRITSVAVTADAQICGEFTYDYSTGKVECKSTSEYDKTVIVSTLGEDNIGDLIGVPLQLTQKLNVKLFVIPNPAVKKMTVSVVTSDSRVWKKELKMAQFQPRQIHPVSLPQLTAKEVEFDYRTWISQLDPRIYISELSLPGSALSFNTTNYVANADPLFVTQTGNIDQQFNAGCRVFQGHIWLVPDESELDGRSGSFALTTSRGRDTGVRLVPMLRALRDQMEGVHSNGFCVVLLSDYKINGTNYTMQDFYERLTVVTQRLDDINILPASEIGPNTTIADVRGKIILKLQLNAYGGKYESTNGGSFETVQNQALDRIASWSYVNGAMALFNWWSGDAGSQVFYAPMVFGNVGSLTITKRATSNTFTASKADITGTGLAGQAGQEILDTSNTGIGLAGRNPGNANCNNPGADKLADNMWFIYSEQANAGAEYDDCKKNIPNVVSAINDTYDPGTHNKFYMTYCGGVGNESYSIQTITDEFNGIWTGAIKNVKNKPYGWVLFNRVVAAESSTKECIQKVISNNNDVNFKLERNRNAVVNNTRPTGDIQGATPGGSLF